MIAIKPLVLLGKGRPRRTCSIAGAMLLVVTSGGCGLVGWGLDTIAGQEKEVEVEADYQGLEGRKVAVIVYAARPTLYRHPDAPMLVTRAVSGRIADEVPTAQLLEPALVTAFQTQNPHWMPYGDLIEQLGVDRLVVVDLAEYTTHDPKNAHAWRGVLSANIRVVERESSDIDLPVYGNVVRVRYPDHPVPLLKSDDRTIELGLLNRFSFRVAGLFHDHRTPPQ